MLAPERIERNLALHRAAEEGDIVAIPVRIRSLIRHRTTTQH